MNLFHVSLMKVIIIEVKADNFNEAKEIAIEQYSHGDHNEAFENTTIQIKSVGLIWDFKND